MIGLTRILTAVAFVSLVVGCGGTVATNDAAVEEADAMVQPDAAVLPDAALPPDAMLPNVPSASASTSGGGAASSTNYKARIRIGAPAPMGDTSSTSFRARLGPPGR